MNGVLTTQCTIIQQNNSFVCLQQSKIGRLCQVIKTRGSHAKKCRITTNEDRLELRVFTELYGCRICI